ncbi:alkaline phosphatase family protein [Luteimicrobium subarcticum]|uniref:Type I phosphodiesterase/nucleotide pyrophosphatase n=1 Tax=Luteimicrobium subarcticum TaxID=620910 RepID=A0A2M8W459_9MICO|nr:alkaline phosphatase family protein [Luteimicrobium subarcticum]PJI85712.1 type I phosphodiesterase/nucleotide pyrophosphatase [Luteimicrobium subarcticum]
MRLTAAAGPSTAPSADGSVGALPDTLVDPAAPGPRLADVLPAAHGALAAAGRASREARAVDAARRIGLPAADRVCVVLCDGLGLENLTERAGHAPFLRGRLGDLRRLVTTYPSTTAAALGTFGTGAPPGRTAMLGYTVRAPQTGRLANLVSWDGAPEPRTWQREPTVLADLASEGVEVTSVGPGRFAGSGMTLAALRGATYVAAESWTSRVERAAAVLRRPGLTYLYWGDVDKAGHHHGWRSAEWGHELEAFDAGLARLARSLPTGTLLLLTADHGMVDVDLEQRWDVATDAVLRDGVPLVAGEPRALHLHLDDDTDPDVVADRWSEHLGDAALVATRDEALAAGLFGDVAPHVRPVVGDVVVATTGRATVVDSRTQTPASLTLVGVHGSLTPHEMHVPLLATVV